MRRFEFTDAKSNKFWEIDVEGVFVTTRWGRIGTGGQTKKKELGSAEAAEKEAAKQIASKQKKGYAEVGEVAEVGEESEPDAAPQAAPVVVPASLPQPGFFPPAPVEARRTEPGRHWNKHWDTDFPDWRAGLHHNEGGLRPVVERAIAALGADQPPTEVDVELFAAMAVLVRGAWWLDVWLPVATPAELHQLIEATSSLVADSTWVNHERQSFLKRKAPSLGGGEGLWVKLGDLGGEEHLAEARAARGAADEVTRWGLSCAWPDEPGWLAEDFDHAMASGQAQAAYALLRRSNDAEFGLPHLLASTDVLGTEYLWWRLVLSHVHHYLRFGERMFEVLLLFKSKARGEEYQHQKIVECLEHWQTPACADAMVGFLEHKYTRKQAMAWFRQHPHLAIPALSGRIAARGERLGTALLGSLVRTEPEVLAALRPVLDDKQSATIDALLAPLEEAASMSDMPAFLQDPPWRRKRKAAKKRVVAGLEPLVGSERIVWAPGERQSARTSVWKTVDPRTHKLTLWELAYRVKDQDMAVACELCSEQGWAGKEEVLGILSKAGLPFVDTLLRLAHESVRTAVLGLKKVDSARVAPLMALAVHKYKGAGREARPWFGLYPENAALGLIPDAVGRDGAQRHAAEKALRLLQGNGHGDIVRAQAARYGAEAAAIVDDILAMDPMDEVPKKAPKLPPFWSAEGVLRPRLRDTEAGRGRAFPTEAMDALAEMLAFTPLDNVYPGVEVIEDIADPASLTDFAWDLFQIWRAHGSEGKHDWIMTRGLGLFGDDETARRLTPLIRKWPGEAGHARAVKGLDVLHAIGSDLALMHLHGISVKLKFKGLRKKAVEKVDLIAAERGLSPEELADRLVPDLDLDPDGSTTLDYGSRQFRVGFDEALKPFVVIDGKRKKDPPKPGARDGKGAPAELKRWRALKKDVKTLAKQQITRLELAMCKQRRWDGATFRTFLLEHPLLIHLVRRLVWGIYEDERLVTAFRVSEDRSLADVEDDPFEFGEVNVGLIHPLDLSPAQRTAWGEVLADYELLQPFAQVRREITRATPEEIAGDAVVRVEGVRIPWGRVKRLDDHGWQSGMPMDAGCIWTYDKPMGGGYMVELELTPGLFAGSADMNEDQTLGKALLRKHEKPATFADLSPVQFSELCRDLEALRG